MAEQESNDHDLLIALNAKVDSILQRFMEMDKLEVRVRENEIKMAGYSEAQNTMRTEIEKLRTQNAVWSGINTIGGIILAVLLAMLGK